MTADRNFNAPNLKLNSYGENKHYQQLKTVVLFACPYLLYTLLRPQQENKLRLCRVQVAMSCKQT